MKSAGQTAYEGYLAYFNGQSLISDPPLSAWEQQSDRLKAAWDYAANCVLKSADQIQAAIGE